MSCSSRASTARPSWCARCRTTRRSTSRPTNTRAQCALPTSCRARKRASCSALNYVSCEHRMNIVCIGGGPAGLYFALLMKQQDPAHRITVVERNRPYDTFGWGVVFSDQTLGNLQQADARTAGQILDAFNHWDDIEVNIRGARLRSGGHGFCGIGRKRLLNILQARCEELGVELRFETDVQGDEQFPAADLVIASDGLNSRIRARHAATYRPDIDVRRNRF